MELSKKNIVETARETSGAGAPEEGLEDPLPLGLLGQALDALSAAALITDAGHGIVYANPAFTADSGYSLGEVLGRNVSMLEGPGTDLVAVAALRATLERGETYKGEILSYRKDGTSFWNAVTISPLRDGQGVITHFVGVQRDASAEKTMQDRLGFLAFHDPVTGLPNRAALDLHLSSRSGSTPGSSRRTAVGIIDFDDFKIVNDTLGTEAGDAVLAEFASRLKGKLRATDFLARLGGDAFAVVIRNLDPDFPEEQLDSILARLHQSVDTHFVLSPTASVRIKMSMGLAFCPPSGDGGNAVLRRAHATLYQLKVRKAVRSRWWDLDDTLSAPASDGGTVLPAATVPPGSGSGTDLAVPQVQALRERLFAGGLHMHYQPVIDLRTGKVHLLEALARLALEDGTVLPPGIFLPLLTEEDIDQLFRAGLDHALGQLAAWDAQGHRLSVSINLAPSTLLDPDCASWVGSALDRHGIAPDRLVVELLENRAEVGEPERRTFNELLALGVDVVLDDLGAGHSSLRRMTALPFSAIKIDRGILAQLRTSPVPTVRFLTSLIQIGQDMGLTVVAEGLEDAGLTEAATILGIHYGQGYHLAGPMPADNILAWVAGFRLPECRGPVRTLPGALAYHWQFARNNSPHPGPLETCPVTAFVAGEPFSQDPADWHHHLHAEANDHHGPSTRLLQWLTRQNTEQPLAGSNTAVSPA